MPARPPRRDVQLVDIEAMTSHLNKVNVQVPSTAPAKERREHAALTLTYENGADDNLLMYSQQ